MSMSDRPHSKKWWLLLAALTSVNLFVRCLFLSLPATPVFDEAFYLKYSLSYCCSHTYYSDLHPPLPKLILGIPGYFSKYRGDYPFDSTGEMPPFDSVHLPIRPMRSITAVVGSLVPMTVFALVAVMGGTAPVAFLAATLVSLENAVALHSSFVLLDQFLLLGIFGSLLFYILALHSHSGRRMVGLTVLSGVFLALAIGTKLTGICAAAAIFCDLVIRFCKAPSKEFFWRHLRIILWGLSAFLVVYLGSWVIHEFLLLGESYRGFGFELIAKLSDRIVLSHWTILQGHLSLGASDTYGSRWWQWLLGYHPLLFWQDQFKTMYFFPNLLIWTGMVLIGLFNLMLVGLSKMSKLGAAEPHPPIRHVRLLILALAVNFLPNIEIKRVLYLYHFLPSLLLLIILNSLCLQRLGLLAYLNNARQKLMFAVIIIVSLAGSVLTLPFSHGVRGGWSRVLKERMDREVNWR